MSNNVKYRDFMTDVRGKLSITKFIFTLEKILLEKKVIHHIRELDWTTVESLANLVVRNYPYFKLNKHQFKSFKENYNQRRKIFQKSKDPFDLELLEDLLRKALDTSTFGDPGRLEPVVGTTVAKMPEEVYETLAQTLSDKLSEKVSETLVQTLSELHSEIYHFKKVVETLRIQIGLVEQTHKKSSEAKEKRISSREAKALRGTKQVESKVTPPACAEPRRPRPEAEPGAAHQLLQPRRPGAKHQLEQPSGEADGLPDLKPVLQSVNSNTVTSKRPFARARQRVALLVLYITGWNVSKLLTLQVRHLKQLRQQRPTGVSQPPTLSGVPVRCEALQAQELITYLIDDMDLLMVDCSDNTPVFRAFSYSTRPCTRAGFTNELNLILSPWKLTTKSLQGEVAPSAT